MGIMEAQLAASVIGIPNNKGFICIASANEETTGAKTITCATLLITSLRKSEIKVTRKIIIKSLTANCANHWPNCSIRPAFSSGYIRLKQMTRVGFVMNLVAIVIITLFAWLVLPLVFNIR